MQYIKYFLIILLILILIFLLNQNTNQQIKENYLDYNLNDNNIIYKKNILEAPKRLIAIGDIHADYKSLRNIFIGLKLIDSNNNWIAEPKNTIVVQVGDQLDGGGRFNGEVSGEDDILNFMEDIHKKANKYKGGIYSLLGNHEIMNVSGDFRFTSSKDILSIGGVDKRLKLYKPGGKYALRLSKTRNVVMKIGSFIFSHAGLLLHHINKDKTYIENIEYINSLMDKYLKNNIDSYNFEIQKYFMNENSILWNRRYGNEDIEKDVCENLDTILKFFNCKSMMVGHSPQDNINSKCDGKIWRLDSGISGCFSINKDKCIVLEILNDGEKFNVITI